MEPLAGEAAQHDHALVERLAGHEPARAEPHAVPVHEAPDVPVVGGRRTPSRSTRSRGRPRSPRGHSHLCASQASSSAASAASRSAAAAGRPTERALPAPTCA